MTRTILLAAVGTAAATALPSDPSATRDFHFSYQVELKDVPSGARRVEVWVPYPQSDRHQTITRVDVQAPAATEVQSAADGNRILHMAVERPVAQVSLTLSFDVQRREYVHRPPVGATAEESAQELTRWLRPDRRVPLTMRVRKLADEITSGSRTDLEKARAIYDHVVSTMRYDKSGSGWGNGDIDWACDQRRGNCTDFHALFIGLARAAGIPAKFAIGFPLPPERGAGEVPGYHCWAEFYLKGYGWVPVDASEACKHPEKKDYFFGAHDANRVQLTVGRDVILAPAQAGEPLNFFVYPYVEVDGKPFNGVVKSFRFADRTS